MKKTILSLCILCCAIVTKAQSSDQLTAILQHGDETKAYNGVNAFKTALSNAADGDVITLSAGTFNGANITKQLTIYGSGYEENESTGTAVTTINGDLNIEKDVYVEGVAFAGNTYHYNLTNSAFVKCLMQRWCARTNLSNVTIQECRFKEVNFDSHVATNLLIKNSQLSWAYAYDASSSVLVDHCLMKGGTRGDYNNTATYTNCIFIYTTSGEYNYTSAGATMKNCIYVNEATVHPQATVTDCFFVELADIFADGENATYTAERTFELQHPETWVGTDGTEIGIRGGDGWSKTPATPVVKNLQLSVNEKTLNVNYESEVR